MPIILAALTLALQIYFIVHVFRTGRPYWWAFVILSAPVIGALFYYFLEVYPGSKEERDAHKLAKKVVKSFKPDETLKKRAAELETCGSVDNKVALAEECCRAGMYEEAVRLYQSALQGPYAKDSHIRYQLINALLDNGSASQARGLIADIRADDPAFRKTELSLLEARALEGVGDAPGAVAIYEKLVPDSVGLETRTRYGLLLKEMGHTRQAQGVFADVVTHANRFKIQHAEERAWLEAAERELGR